MRHAEGTDTAPGFKSMARDFGTEANMEPQTDAVAGNGMATRLIVGKARTLATQWLWIQRVFPERLATVERPTDEQLTTLTAADVAAPPPTPPSPPTTG